MNYSLSLNEKAANYYFFLLSLINNSNANRTHEEEKLDALCVSASRDSIGVVHISLTNIDLTKAHKVELRVRGHNFPNTSAEVLTSSAVQGFNSFEKPNQIQTESFNAYCQLNNTIWVEISPFSVIKLTLDK